MPQETKAKFETPTTDTAAPSLAGLAVDLADAQSAFDILEKAFDYRGDVTLTLKDASVVTGYLFDRRRGTGLNDSVVRLLPPDASSSTGKVTVPYNQIARIAFSDRDPAAGKSFETWVKKYVEKKLKGERASIESEKLD